MQEKDRIDFLQHATKTLVRHDVHIFLSAVARLDDGAIIRPARDVDSMVDLSIFSALQIWEIEASTAWRSHRS